MQREVKERTRTKPENACKRKRKERGEKSRSEEEPTPLPLKAQEAAEPEEGGEEKPKAGKVDEVEVVERLDAIRRCTLLSQRRGRRSVVRDASSPL